MSFASFIVRGGLGSALALALAACAPSTYQVKEPSASGLKYEVVGSAASARLAFLDERRGEERNFSTGRLPATLLLDSGPLDPMQFLSRNVATELESRGLPISTVVGEGGQPSVRVRTFRMQNHRTNGYTPFYTSTYISADLETAQGPRRITAFVHRGKTPVWSFAEVVDPTFNQPLSIAVKEFSSKLAAAMYSYKASDTKVRELIAKATATPTDDTFLDVYALGFTNNPLAADTLASLAGSPSEYVRLAAISSLGILRAGSQFGLLKKIYQDTNASRQDRDMALKSIADLGTPESEAFIREEMKQLGTKGDADSQGAARVLALYL